MDSAEKLWLNSLSKSGVHPFDSTVNNSMHFIDAEFHYYAYIYNILFTLIVDIIINSFIFQFQLQRKFGPKTFIPNNEMKPQLALNMCILR